MPQTSNQIIDLSEPPVCAAVGILVPQLTQLALGTNALDRQDRLVYLGVVRPMRMTVHPTAHIIRQPIRCVTGTGGG